jgi:hypothetical protein
LIERDLQQRFASRMPRAMMSVACRKRRKMTT